jgi:hypothetical protein
LSTEPWIGVKIRAEVVGWADAMSRAAVLLRVPAEDLADAFARHFIDSETVTTLGAAELQNLLERDLHAHRSRTQILAALGQLVSRRWADAD